MLMLGYSLIAISKILNGIYQRKPVIPRDPHVRIRDLPIEIETSYRRNVQQGLI